MRTNFTVDDMTIHRIVEQEQGFTPILEFLPTLTEELLAENLRLLPTPGHTPDHFAVSAGRGRDAAVFTGDLIYSPIQARYPELLMRIDTDQAEGVVTRRAFFERYCDTDTLCCTMHFPSPSAGHIKRWGDGFRLDYIND